MPDEIARLCCSANATLGEVVSDATSGPNTPKGRGKVRETGDCAKMRSLAGSKLPLSPAVLIICR